MVEQVNVQSPYSKPCVMGKAIIECVPNISEGKDLEKIHRIVDAARIPGVMILGIEPDSDYNRTVITFAGNPSDVELAAYLLIQASIHEIDMRTHTGEHPRMGCVDVCPFVPISGSSMKQCVDIAERVARKVGELAVPVFMYGGAASDDSRSSLSTLRKGEYEGLMERFTGNSTIHTHSTRFPDFGTKEWDETAKKSGAITIGARDLLIAYNVNIDEKDALISKQIGSIVRSSGRLMKSDNNVKKFRTEGLLAHVQGMGVPLESHGISQVSMNLQQYRSTNLHHAYDVISSLAKDMGGEAKGSEIVGLVPLESMLEAGKWYADSEDLSEEDYVTLAIEKLGLSSIHNFNPHERIIEWCLEGDDQ
jgi:glutamate formiminotransferase/formiminotetrahydrofolate cyclodeaminase